MKGLVVYQVKLASVVLLVTGEHHILALLFQARDELFLMSSLLVLVLLRYMYLIVTYDFLVGDFKIAIHCKRIVRMTRGR